MEYSKEWLAHFTYTYLLLIYRRISDWDEKQNQGQDTLLMSCQQINSLGNGIYMYNMYGKTRKNIEQNMDQEQPRYWKCGINKTILIWLHLWSTYLKQAYAKYEKSVLGKVHIGCDLYRNWE